MAGGLYNCYRMLERSGLRTLFILWIPRGGLIWNWLCYFGAGCVWAVGVGYSRNLFCSSSSVWLISQAVSNQLDLSV